ncbi:uncharacterized protein [Clytia hemisphaerica]|uniref:BHLH domain-containing protein n=1 Tax=Clytia hemisphaerica TaxID=252671 RepID=A0A7M5V0N1_9CNID
MACQTLQTLSVLERRGFTLPEISISSEDFNGNLCETKDMKQLDEILCYLTSPLAITKSMVKLTKEDASEPSLATPKILTEDKFEKYLTDITMESPTIKRKQNNTVLSPLPRFSNQKPREQMNSQQETNIPLFPSKSADSITPNTSFVVGRLTEDNGDEFNIYFPDSSITNTQTRIGQYNSIFQFPDSPNLAFENKENGGKKNDFRSKDSPDSEFKIRKSKKNQNIIERRRRVEQHQRFQKLASSIPYITNKKTLPKIMILRAAKQFLEILHREEQDLLDIKSGEKQKNQFLLNRLASLSSL